MSVNAKATILRAVDAKTGGLTYGYEVEVTIPGFQGKPDVTKHIVISDSKAKQIGFINLTDGGRDMVVDVRWFPATNDIGL